MKLYRLAMAMQGTKCICNSFLDLTLFIVTHKCVMCHKWSASLSNQACEDASNKASDEL